MTPFGEGWDWLTDGENWRGPEGILARVGEHLTISAQATLLALLIALPVAITLGHLHRGGFLAASISNVGRAIPSFALLALCARAFGYDSRTPIIVALVALAVPVIMTNTYVGITQVEPDVVEAARGMGMSGRQVVFRVELPIAMPLIMGALRTSVVLVIATATLAAALPQGGLGRFIFDGQAQNDNGKLIGGAVLVAVLAVLAELFLGLVQRMVSPLDRIRGGLAPGTGGRETNEAAMAPRAA